MAILYVVAENGNVLMLNKITSRSYKRTNDEGKYGSPHGELRCPHLN